MTKNPALERVRAGIARVLRGKPEAIESVLVGLVAGGHVLFEDVPGVGKTTLAKALSRSFELKLSRVQLTPDLLPSDILGAQVLDPRAGTFTFHRGPIFANVVLADEINRASPRTQSALLEAMSEGQVTVDDVTHALPRPFFVIATQNPSDYHGTYPLPEAQLDRFMLRVGVGYPSEAEELAMVFAQQRESAVDHVEVAATGDELIAMQREVQALTVSDGVGRYLLAIVRGTRQHEHLDVGVSPRGTIALFRACQGRAYVRGRAYVSPEDVQALASPVLAHRVQLTPQARYGGVAAEAVIGKLLASLPVPT
ncbi:MAG: MoxR family ATPase [Deltaproteobacteria bacterium]|nr:MoxR family ATPase [Deltaproteobacteria bacterium]